MSGTATGAKQQEAAADQLSAADEQVIRELTERARSGGLKLTGEDGLLGRLTKMVVEGALEGELDDHLTVPRDRDSSFGPQIVAKRQRRLSGLDDLVVPLSAKGLTRGET
jgi:transposase-like protein